jgi:hypothetical protein
MFRITDKEFVYTPSYDTDLGKKFRAILEKQRKESQRRAKNPEGRKSMVVPLAPIGQDSIGA